MRVERINELGRSRNMNKCYYYGIQNDEELETVYQILTTGGIKSEQLLNRNKKGSSCGKNYISICQKESPSKKNSNNAFDQYIQGKYCFILSDMIPILPLESDVEELPLDCYRVLGEISLDQMMAIGIPSLEMKRIQEVGSIEEREILETIQRLTESLRLEIVDSSAKNFEEHYEKGFKKNKSKIKNRG